MKIHPLLVSITLGAILSLQAWMLTKISTLSENVAGLTARVEDLAGSKHFAKQ